jgi:hypothetical protein
MKSIRISKKPFKFKSANYKSPLRSFIYKLTPWWWINFWFITEWKGKYAPTCYNRKIFREGRLALIILIISIIVFIFKK